MLQLLAWNPDTLLVSPNKSWLRDIPPRLGAAGFGVSICPSSANNTFKNAYNTYFLYIFLWFLSNASSIFQFVHNIQQVQPPWPTAVAILATASTKFLPISAYILKLYFKMLCFEICLPMNMYFWPARHNLSILSAHSVRYASLCSRHTRSWSHTCPHLHLPLNAVLA